MSHSAAVPAAPFCLFHQDGVTRIATGTIHRSELLQDLPRPTGLPVISMVPYAQLKERGFALHDGGEPIVSLVAEECREVDLDEILDGAEPEFSVGEVVFDVSDEEFTDVVRRVIEDEICRGEGSNFLISRRGRVHIEGFSTQVAKTVFRRLARNELGAYFTFCFFDGERYFIGSSPERHISIKGEAVVMNPICGTLPKAALGSRSDLIEFLTDPKEINELFQVVDEELKMMARICSEGGVVKGPFLKEMGSLIHTEYLLEGHSRMDKIDAFRDSMFAATMIGSPLENAARVIHKYERESRRYYSSAIMVHGLDDSGEEYLDSAITIRTMEVSAAGEALLQSGCSVVRDSSPQKETKEVQAKIAGLLKALRSTERTQPVLDRYVDDRVAGILQSRNAYLSRFWIDDQQGSMALGAPALKSILIVDNEDEFTHMLGHVFQHLGLDVTVRDYDHPELNLSAADLVLVGPGPGDPRDLTDPKMATVHRIVGELLQKKAKFIAVCLGHQVVSSRLGMEIVRVDPPLQGVQQQVDLFGQHEPVGFYNTFFARRPEVAPPGVEIAAMPDGRVIALRSENFCTFQFHVESLLTSNCVSILGRALEWLR
jgi:phenazine biosynthesis protein phzE